MSLPGRPIAALVTADAIYSAGFDFNAVPMDSKARVMALAAGDRRLDQSANILLFGPHARG
jgi:DNA replication protein DnaC